MEEGGSFTEKQGGGGGGGSTVYKEGRNVRNMSEEESGRGAFCFKESGEEEGG